MSSGRKIAVVDYGAGNLRSVAKALERSGFTPEIVTEPAQVRAASAVVLPGVGAFPDAVKSLRAKGLEEALVEGIRAGVPYLGFCLGLQLLFEEGDEHGVCKGFGLFEGRVEHFPKSAPDGRALRIPHIGWNEVTFRGDHPMLRYLPERDFFYFVHSYRAVPGDESLIAGSAEHGEAFTAAIARENIFAVQFHPEKSQWAGKRLLDAFGSWVDSRS